MYTIAPHLNALPMLYEQYRLYTEQLGTTHAGLSKLYKKLAKAERKMNERDDWQPTRAQAKKLWWSHTIAKQSIGKLESQKQHLHNLLQQCQDLIDSYSQKMYLSPATTFWTSYHSTGSDSPWPAGSYRMHLDQQSQQTQYWDLSMLGERVTSPTDSSNHDVDSHQAQDAEHMFAHETMDASCCSAAGAASVGEGSASGSEGDDLPEMIRPAMLDVDKANTSTRRRYSDAAVRQYRQRPGLFQVQPGGTSTAAARGERTLTAPLLETSVRTSSERDAI
ncbi:hypothetical protein AMS68_004687 [Peltaster fructicola]|uniref:Uncharacterized protein n=1 Tax=Peltaster fructicola TaxID=286661 RepID=A0A6H0XXM2_9PEZI|nr:hypothetical protein AMS68_004687 [Peltaster fructicola]